MKTIRCYYQKVSPYSLHDYRQDVVQVISKQLLFLKMYPVRPVPRVQEILQTGAVILDPHYAAQWSALARKRKAGLLLLYLYYVAAQNQLDMTVILAQRLLEGWVSCSISNKVLIQAFGQHSRTAKDKSKDWEHLATLIERYQAQIRRMLLQDKLKMARIKQVEWARLNPNPK